MSNIILFLLSFIAISIIIDRNVEDYIIKLIAFAINKIRRFIWAVFNHPLIHTKSIFKFFIFLKYYFHSIRTRTVLKFEDEKEKESPDKN